MDKALERSHKDKVYRRLATLLRDQGYARTKPTFFTRPRGLLVEFVHLHKYTFAPEFRVHLGIRVTNDAFDAVALNGPDSHPYVCKGSPGGRIFDFSFHVAPETIERCAAEIADYVRTVGEPWFLVWRDDALLLDRADSPLRTAKADFKSALEHGPRPERVAQTSRLLGLRAV